MEIAQKVQPINHLSLAVILRSLNRRNSVQASATKWCKIQVFTPNLHIPGVKDDDDKPIVEDVLVAFANALELVAQIGTAGAKRCTLHGWEHVPDGILGLPSPRL